MMRLILFILFFFLSFLPVYPRDAKSKDFRLRDSDGKIFVLSKHNGELTILDFFNPLLSACTNDIIQLTRLQDRYSKKNVHFIGLMEYTHLAAMEMKKLKKRYRINFPVLRSTPEVRADFGGIFSVPTVLILGPGRTVLEKNGGYVNEDILAEKIERYLAADRRSGPQEQRDE